MTDNELEILRHKVSCLESTIDTYNIIVKDIYNEHDMFWGRIKELENTQFALSFILMKLMQKFADELEKQGNSPEFAAKKVKEYILDTQNTCGEDWAIYNQVINELSRK